MTPAGSRAFEAAVAALTPKLGAGPARERAAQVFSVIACDWAEVLVANAVPSFAALARPAIASAREPHCGGVPLTEAEIDALARAFGAACEEHLAVHCPRCKGTGGVQVVAGASYDCERCGGEGFVGRGERLDDPDAWENDD